MAGPPQITLSDECHPQQPKRIHRPPNAFFLYRSDFLKTGAIPPEVEKRQQHLSRIVGQCWKMLPDTEKAIWYDKAAAVRAEHRFEHYKPRSSHKNKDRHLTNDKKRSHKNPHRLPSRPSSRQTQAPCYEDVFSAHSPSASISLGSPTPASGSSSSTVSLALLPLAQSLPSFTSYTNSSSRDNSSTAFEDLATSGFHNLLGSSASEVGQDESHSTRDRENVVFGEIGSFQELYPALPRQRYATLDPFYDLERVMIPHSCPVSQFSPDLSTGYCSGLPFILE